MSSVDPEILYLILSKVALKVSFYTLDGKTLTITPKQLSEIYERITGSRVGSRVNWNLHLTQLNNLLLQCGLPAIGDVLSDQEKVTKNIEIIHSTKWPTFVELKQIYAKKNLKKTKN